jgi:hypothetical protein
MVEIIENSGQGVRGSKREKGNEKNEKRGGET